MVWYLLILICSVITFHMTLFQGRVFSADPSGLVFPVFQRFPCFPPYAPVTSSETQSSGELFRLKVMRGAFHDYVRDRFFFDATLDAVRLDSLVFSAVTPGG